jgi:hypothetical protein
MTRAARTRDLRSWDLRPIWIGITVMILIATALEVAALFRIIDGQSAVTADYRYYVDVARRWVDTGVFYTDRQLAGPYQVTTLVDNLYPPHALYLFLPLLVLPEPMWWVIPLGLIAYVVWWCRPAIAAWPLLALLVLFPKTPNQIIYGNTDMWVTAGIAAGVRWGWPAVLISMKPSLSIFGLLGIRSRAWWRAAAALFLLSLPFAALWLQYPTVMGNSSAGWYYSFGNLPFFVLPIVAWLASTLRGDHSRREWAISLLGRQVHYPRHDAVVVPSRDERDSSGLPWRSRPPAASKRNDP